MSLYTVLSRVRHDQVVYEAGSVISDITEEAAKLLIEAGAVVRADESTVAEQVKEDVATVEQQVATDVAQAEAAVVAEQHKPSLIDRAKAVVSGTATDVVAPVTGQPTAEEVAQTAAKVQ